MIALPNDSGIGRYRFPEIKAVISELLAGFGRGNILLLYASVELAVTCKYITIS